MKVKLNENYSLEEVEKILRQGFNDAKIKNVISIFYGRKLVLWKSFFVAATVTLNQKNILKVKGNYFLPQSMEGFFFEPSRINEKIKDWEIEIVLYIEKMLKVCFR